MPRGSKIGERRGGRERGTPNRRTVLADRILEIAPEHATASAPQFVEVLVKDRKLPADIRMAIARNFLSVRTPRSVRVRAASSSADQRRKAKSTSPLPDPSGTAKCETLDILFNIAQDTGVHPDQRRKAASEAAQHFLPKKLGIKKWWVNAVPDEYGFAITPQIAAEYRDIRIELRRLRGNSPAIARRAAKMRERLNAILHRLSCPCPSQYGKDQLDEDGRRLIGFLRLRETEVPLSETQNAAEAHCRARYDCYFEGPEMAARERLSLLEVKERGFRISFGPRLTRKEAVELRFLRLLYPRSRQSPLPPDQDDFYQPLRDAPLAVDGNLYPSHSKLAPLKEGEIEEFVDVPPYVIGHPGYPGHRWLWKLPAHDD